MEQAVKAPGRPRAKAETTENIEVKIPQPKWNNKDKVYRIVEGGGIVFSLKQNGVTVYDEKSNTIRELRFCPNEPSVWRDEQSQYARREHVMFYDGALFVPHTKPNLIAYLELHPDNVKNGGAIYELVDNEKKAEEVLLDEFVTLDAVAMVRDKDIQELLPIAMYYNINVNRPSAEVRYDLLQQARSNPKRFIESFDNPLVRVRSIIKTAEMYQLVALRDNGSYWFDSNRLILSTPVGQDSIDVLARFCLTEKGASVYAELEAQVSRL
jgi:hypothetical protein